MADHRKILAVFGATGVQGGSLLRTVTTHPKLNGTHKVRALTRDASKTSAASLASQDVEVVQTDLNSVDSLKVALRNVDTVFLVTQFFDILTMEGEVQQGKNVIEAIKSTKAHFIFSSFAFGNIVLPNLENFNDIQHWVSKLLIEKAALEILGPQRCTFVCLGTYMEYFKTLYSPKKTGPDSYTIQVALRPSSILPVVNARRDTGKFIVPLLLDPARYAGKHIMAAAEPLTLSQIANIMTDVTGKNVSFEEVSDDTFWNELLPEEMRPLRPVMGGLTGFVREHGFLGSLGQEGLNWSLEQIEEKPQTLRQFMQEEGAWFHTNE